MFDIRIPGASNFSRIMNSMVISLMNGEEEIDAAMEATAKLVSMCAVCVTVAELLNSISVRYSGGPHCLVM